MRLPRAGPGIEPLEARRLLASAIADAAPTVDAAAAALPARQMENLDRGVVAIRSSNQVFVSWRLLAPDPAGVGFNVYRSANGAAPVKLNSAPLTAGTNYTDTAPNLTQGNAYTVRAVVGGVEQPASKPFVVPAYTPARQYLSVPLQVPPGGTTPSGEAYTYHANDASVGDLDGDGQYEIVLKWDPSNAKDNSQSGYTGNVYVDAYEMDGTRLWRIDLGRNIRAGAHYTQFIVYDLDGDGRAEVAMKTGDGTVSGTGQTIGNASADHRNSSGYILSGPEYLSVFNGFTGAAMATVPFSPPRGTVSSWGDSYGNRVDRFLATTAYLDGVRPSLVMSRGYYAKTEITAFDWRNGQLTQRWAFSSTTSGNGGYAGQGNHGLAVADVDDDGKDEIVFGAATIDDDGRGLYTTGLGHGDAMHVSDMIPSRPGQEVFKIMEAGNQPAAALWDAATGQRIFTIPNGTGTEGPGRGVAADIYAAHPGYEYWGAGINMTGLFDETGAQIGRQPGSSNFLVWWDADLTRELLNGNRIHKYGTSGDTLLLDAVGASSINGTKSTPNLSGDLLGDWREEVIWRSNDSSELRIYTTSIPTATRLVTLMHDAQYRQAIAWQNVAYNQPPHPSYFLGNAMAAPPAPNHYYAVSNGVPPAAPAGLVATPSANGAVNLSWSAVPGASHYRVKRAFTSSGPFVTLASDVAAAGYVDAAVESGGSYFYVVTAIAGTAEGANSNVANAALPLPAPWVAQDIGAANIPGRSTFADGVFTAAGSGAGIGGNADSIRLVYQPVNGDGALVTRVTAIDATSEFAHAGLMYRKSTAAGAAFAAVTATPGGRIFFYRRSSDGGNASYSVAYTDTPVWLKLTRSGSAFGAFYSVDGVAWTQVGGTQTIAMPATVPGGAVHSASNANDFGAAKLAATVVLTDPNVYPAEIATTGGAALLESDNAGYRGAGYINFPATGGFTQFANVDGGAGGNATIRFRYALGTAAARTGRLLVNGVARDITFAPTGGWTTWQTLALTVPLNAGAANVIRLESTGADLANIDELEVVQGGEGSVAGKAFHDKDGDDVFNAGDAGLPGGVTVFLDGNGDGAPNAGEPTTTTTAAGDYAFAAVPAGSYTVRTAAPGFAAAVAPTIVVTAGGANGGVNVPHGQTLYTGTAGDDHYRVRKNTAGKYEVYLGGVLAHTLFAAAPSLTFNTLGGADTLVLDLANGAPIPAGGVTFDGGAGAGADELSLVGTAAAQTLLINAADVAFAGVTGKAAHANVESVRFDGNGGWDALTLTGGPPVTFADAQQFQALVLSGASVAKFAAGASATVARSLALSNAATLDIADTTLIVDTTDANAAGAWDGSAYTGLLGRVAAGYNGGAWDAAGIVTSAPRALTGVTTVGLATGEQALALGAGDTAMFEGQTVTGRSVIIKYSYAGDANFDGKLDADDYGGIDFNVLLAAADGYANGDFNFDGRIDADDYGVIDFNILAQDGPL